MHRNMLVIWIRLHNSDTTNRVFARNGDLESVSYVLLELNHKTVINIHLKKKKILAYSFILPSRAEYKALHIETCQEYTRCFNYTRLYYYCYILVVIT